MKFVSGAILSVSLLAGFLAAAHARAEDAPTAPAPPPACEVPDYFLSGDIPLPKVAEAIKAGGPLNIMVVGSRSSMIGANPSASETAAYPGQMLAALKAKLPVIAGQFIRRNTGQKNRRRGRARPFQAGRRQEAYFGDMADGNRRCYALG